MVDFLILMGIGVVEIAIFFPLAIVLHDLFFLDD
jgi:hypothetical protein